MFCNLRPVILLISFVLMADANAGDAKCGDSRSIAREAYELYSVYDCRDERLIEEVQADALADAEASSRKRLEKFDTECTKLSGKVDEVAIYREPYAEVIYRKVPKGRYCAIGAVVEIKHKCVCE